MKHFRVFGCLAFVHVPDVNRKKLDSRSTKCVLLGVSEESKAYKLYDPASKRIIVSRDVVFEESKGCEWDEKTTTGMIEMEDSYENRDDSRNEVNNDEENVNDTEDHVNSESSNNDSTDEEDSEDENNNHPNNNQTDNRRARNKPNYLHDYVTGQELDEEIEQHNLALFSTNSDPVTYEEAVKHEEWRNAMDQEIESIERNNTWDLTSLPSGAKKIGVKWVYKTKLNEKGKIEKYKARLAAKGYSHQYGIYYNEVFAPVTRWDTIRSILSVAACKSWNVYKLDVKSAFLHGELTENVYIEQLAGYQKEGNDKVYKLKKVLCKIFCLIFVLVI